MSKHFNDLLVCHNNVISLACGNFDICDFVVIYMHLKSLSIDSHNLVIQSHQNRCEQAFSLSVSDIKVNAEDSAYYLDSRGNIYKRNAGEYWSSLCLSLSLILSFSLLKRPKMFKRHNRGRAGYSKVSNRLLVTLISGILFNVKLRHGASRL